MRRSSLRTRWTLLVPLAFALTGLLFVTSGTTARGTDVRSERSDLSDVIRDEQRDLARQVASVEALRADVDALVESASRRDQRVQGAQGDADAHSEAAHLAPAAGPGLRVTLTDAPREGATPPDALPDDLVVHQQDVQAVVNAMWAGGAEAVQLMDQRVISTSAVRCVGNVLILQGRQYSPPYVITAVGDVEGMAAQLAADSQLELYRLLVDYVGLGYTQERTGEVVLPAYEGGLELRHARAAAQDAVQ